MTEAINSHTQNYIRVTVRTFTICEGKLLSCIQLFLTPWTVAHQAPPPMGFSRQEYCSGLPFPSPGDLPDAGMEPRSPALHADTLLSESPGKPLLFVSGTKLTLLSTNIHYLVRFSSVCIKHNLVS